MVREEIRLLADIGKTIADSIHPSETLQRIVTLIATRCDVDVCSVYLLDDQDNTLVLKATIGLRPESIGKIRMKKEEGLTGLVLEQMAPVFTVNPSSHPRYKYFSGSGEETYRTFIGLPLAFHQQVLGVLVVQTHAPDGVSREDVPIFAAIAGQIAAVLAYGGVLEDLKKQKTKTKPNGRGSAPVPSSRRRKKGRRGFLRGTGVSRGVAEGRAHYLGRGVGFEQIQKEEKEDLALELVRLEKAFLSAENEVSELLEETGHLVDQDRAIMEAHVMFLRDTAFRKKIEARIREGNSAEFALKGVISEYMERFLNMEDPYLRDRSSDIEDIGKRVLRRLLGIERKRPETFDEDTIIVATDLSPVDLIRLRQVSLKGIVLSRGGKTSHTAILARSFEIPMVVGVSDLPDVVQDRDALIVDGTSGLVFDQPPEVIVEEYKRLKEETALEYKRLDALRDIKAHTKDGVELALGANIGLLSDLELVKKYGADHIGLYRTEFPFLMRKDFPSEHEQAVLYQKIVGGAEGRSVTIRTLDVGGDKFLPYLDAPKEQNPYLGWRSIRVSLDLDDIFRIQIRAILTASHFGKVSVLFPMITSVGEVKRIATVLAEEKERLRSRKIPFDPHVPFGIMVEVPAAAKILDRLLPHVDFISIGTNDLIQYVLAVDRNNEKVADIYNPLHPAVIATIHEVVHIAQSHGKPISICGEAASNPLCAFIFLAMGVNRLSMNPASVPVIKDFLQHVSLEDARHALKRINQMDDTEEITAALKRMTEL